MRVQISADESSVTVESPWPDFRVKEAFDGCEVPRPGIGLFVEGGEATLNKAEARSLAAALMAATE